MRSGMTSQKYHIRGVHGKSCKRTRTPRRESIKLRSRGRTSLVQSMRPVPECPRAHPIATQNLTSWQKTNSLRRGAWQKWKLFLAFLLLMPPITRQSYPNSQTIIQNWSTPTRNWRQALKNSRARIDNSSRRSTISVNGWAETQRTMQGVLGQVAAAPTANVMFFTRLMTANNCRRMPATIRMAGAAACDEVGLLVEMYLSEIQKDLYYNLISAIP